MYNLTNVTDNANNMYEIARDVGVLSPYFWTLVLLAFFVVSLIYFRNRSEAKDNFLASSFIVLVVAFLFFAIQLINFTILKYFIIAFIVIFIITIMS